MNGTRKRVAILISGRGTNMAKLIEAAEDPAYPGEIVGVVSDVPEAPGLVFAGDKGISTAAIPRADYESKEAHDAAIDTALEELGAEVVCLAGYMRLLTMPFVEKWEGHLINIHPALLPSFRGLDTHRRALEAGVRIHGCTVHFVTAELDQGPIVVQAVVPVRAADDEASLAARVLKQEHVIYPRAARWFLDGKLALGNGMVRVRGGDAQIVLAAD
jgi:phosphoribosylglycinamide formyltransferase-1